MSSLFTLYVSHVRLIHNKVLITHLIQPSMNTRSWLTRTKTRWWWWKVEKCNKMLTHITLETEITHSVLLESIDFEVTENYWDSEYWNIQSNLKTRWFAQFKYQNCIRQSANLSYDSTNFENKFITPFKIDDNNSRYSAHVSKLREATRESNNLWSSRRSKTFTRFTLKFQRIIKLSIEFGHSDTLIYCLNFVFHSHFNR